MQELADKKEIEMAKIQKDLIIANKAEGTKVQVQSMKDKSASFQVGFNAVKDQMNRQSERDHGAAEKDKDRQFSAVQAATKGGQE